MSRKTSTNTISRKTITRSRIKIIGSSSCIKATLAYNPQVLFVDYFYFQLYNPNIKQLQSTTTSSIFFNIIPRKRYENAGPNNLSTVAKTRFVRDVHQESEKLVASLVRIELRIYSAFPWLRCPTTSAANQKWSDV